MGQYVHVLTRHVGPMAATSKEEKPTARAHAGRAAGHAAVRLCENLPYIGSILREFEIIPYYGHTYA